MTRIWNSRQDVNVAVRTIATIHAKGNGLPGNLVEAYKKILSTASKGHVTYFYQQITEQCPEVLAFFQDAKAPTAARKEVG